ncbi:unnamed protein product [Prorocentrum cordatum]|uniref:Uncharacterized protein n=1 Tax=Prorocentrum cordatum TaxID=2364126 RepID=A0ABN9RTB3_9DINO|nr:unnamed protein product [Polarella glacialis]
MALGLQPVVGGRGCISTTTAIKLPPPKDHRRRRSTRTRTLRRRGASWPRPSDEDRGQACQPVPTSLQDDQDDAPGACATASVIGRCDQNGETQRSAGDSNASPQKG